jgi:ribosomal protein S18 acetylase RimI-like enzyme
LPGRETELDRIAFAAWPAEEVRDLEGWRLRCMAGVSRRGNSVWTGAATGGLSMGARVESVERWYAARHLPALFQVGTDARPHGLDAFLSTRGYRIDAPVSVQVADASRVPLGDPAVRVRVERSLPVAWFAISAHRGRFAAVADTYRGLLERIGDRARFALADVDGRPAAVALGVVEGPWMGVFSMLTVPEARRRGAAKSALGGLARDALESGQDRLYLLVERDNAAALALYHSASFEECGGYHYRVAPGRS